MKRMAHSQRPTDSQTIGPHSGRVSLASTSAAVTPLAGCNMMELFA
jgi:hypothetical protein